MVWFHSGWNALPMMSSSAISRSEARLIATRPISRAGLVEQPFIKPDVSNLCQPARFGPDTSKIEGDCSDAAAVDVQHGRAGQSGNAPVSKAILTVDEPASVMPRNRIFLRQGTTFCTPTPSVVSTVLGSCVAVSLWDIDLHVGGLNHYVLPHRMQELLSARFGDVAIDQLLHGMARLGCRVASLRAKIYGGAEVLPFGAGGDTVGNQNVRIALELLQHHGIPIVGRHTGGHTGMLIRLYTVTGDVLMRRLSGLHLAQADQLQEAGVPFST